MGWVRGFEPPTSGSTIRRSNQLSYTHHFGSGEVENTLTEERMVPNSAIRRNHERREKTASI
jgi:hypothetical protein